MNKFVLISHKSSLNTCHTYVKQQFLNVQHNAKDFSTMNTNHQSNNIKLRGGIKIIK